MARQTVRYLTPLNQRLSARSLSTQLEKGGAANDEELTQHREESKTDAEGEARTQAFPSLSLRSLFDLLSDYASLTPDESLIAIQVFLGGGVFRGIQKGLPNHPPLILFTHPSTGSTIAVPFDDQFGANAVRVRLAAHIREWHESENRGLQDFLKTVAY